MTVTDEMVEKAARRLCRKRILDNLRFDGEMQDAEFQQRAEDASWTDFRRSSPRRSPPRSPLRKVGRRRNANSEPKNLKRRDTG